MRRWVAHRLTSTGLPVNVFMGTGGLELAVTHLNAPVGPIVTVEHLAQALRAGSVGGLDKRTAAIVSYLFVELEPG